MSTCNSCKHYHKDGLCQHWCRHPDNGINVVTGEPQIHLCTFARNGLFGTCGPSAHLYELAEAPPPPPPPRPWYLAMWERIKGVF